MLQFLLKRLAFPWGTLGGGAGFAHAFLARRREDAIEERHSSLSFLQPEDLSRPTSDQGFPHHRPQDSKHCLAGRGQKGRHIHVNDSGFAQRAPKLLFLSSIQPLGHLPYVYNQTLGQPPFYKQRSTFLSTFVHWWSKVQASQGSATAQKHKGSGSSEQSSPFSPCSHQAGWQLPSGDPNHRIIE